MSQLIIVTTPQNSGLGTPLATAFNYCNSNFGELYARAQSSPPATLIGSPTDEPGMYAYDSTYFYYCFASYDGSTAIWAQLTQVGNITLPEIQNGTSNVNVVAPDGNVTIGVAGTSNVVVVSQTGANIKGIVSATGNIRGNYILGNGSQLTGLPATYGNANVTSLLSSFGSNTISTTGTVTGGNIDSGGQVSAVGNVVGNYILGNGSQLTGIPASYSNANAATFLANLGSNVISTTGNITSGNVNTSGIVSATGNINSGGNLNTIGSVVSQGIVSATGNIVTSGYFVGTFVGNVTGNFVIPGSNTQVVFNTNGNADAVGGMTYNKDSNTFTVLGVVSSQGNVIGGNLVTGGQVSATGNITGGNLTVTNVTGTLTTASQNNITSVGTLTSLSVTGNVNSGDLTSSNVYTGGVVSATGNVRGGNLNTVGLVTATGNVTGGNLLTAGLISAAGNITGTNLTGTLLTASQNNITSVGTLTSLSVTGNIQGGNLRTAGQLSATGNIRGGNITSGQDIAAGGNISATNYTGVAISVTGNINVGNIASGNILNTGSISTAGNITGNYLFGNGSQLTGVTSSYGDSNVAAFLSSFGSNSITTSGAITTTSFLNGNIIQGTSLNISNGISGATLTGNLTTASQPNIASVGTLTSLSVSGNINGSNLSLSGTTTSLNVAGNVSLTGTVTAASTVGGVITGSTASLSGNVTSGNLSVGTGTVTLGGITNANANAVGNIGSSANYFNTVFAKATSAQYADLAENYLADQDYPTGTVVIFGGDKEITVTTEQADERVAGAISENPAHLMNAGMPGLAVALRGRVPVRVTGAVTKGDSLVTSTIPGVAISIGRSRDYGQAVFAKAIETDLTDGEKVITAVIL
jgi:hypothetical protein